MADDNRGPQASAVAVVFLVTSWVAIILRVYVRCFVKSAFGIDDALAIVSLFLFTFYCAFVLDGVRHGTGQRMEVIGLEGTIAGMKSWWIAEIGYVSCTTVLKLSIGWFLLRVCVRRIQKVIIWVVLSIVTAYNVYYFCLVIWQCRPTSYFWNQYDGHHKGKCFSAGMVAGSTYAHSALSAVVDWTFGLLPISLVWDLKLNKRSKISVCAILALGALGSTATVVRIPYIYQLTATKDFLYANVDVSIWSTVEPGIGITASSMATLRPLFTTFFMRSGSSSTRKESWGPNSHKGYFRSCADRDDRGAANGMSMDNLRRDLPKGNGVSTTIQSMNDHRDSIDDKARDYGISGREVPGDDVEAGNTARRVQRFGSMKKSSGDSTKNLHVPNSSGGWNFSEGGLADDSGSEHNAEAACLEIRKTTEVRTVRE